MGVEAEAGGCCGCRECESESSNLKDQGKVAKSENNEGRFRTFWICDGCGCKDVYRSSIESDETTPENCEGCEGCEDCEDCEDCESGCESSDEGKSAKCCIIRVGGLGCGCSERANEGKTGEG